MIVVKANNSRLHPPHDKAKQKGKKEIAAFFLIKEITAFFLNQRNYSLLNAEK